jgi:hypothetical protein
MDNADFTFTGNRAGDTPRPSKRSFVIFADKAADRFGALPR